MDQNSDKIILFPTWQKDLEQESLEAMREKNYDEALEKINKLLYFNAENHELYIAKLICLMELRDHQGALELSELMLERKDDNYFQYVHIYLTVLFQMGCYEQLIEHVQYEFTEHEVPAVLAEQFQKLKEASQSLFEEMKIQQGVEYLQEFQQAIDDRAFERQWHIIMNIRKNGLHMHQQFIDLLASDDMHPMIQTAIFMGLQDKEVSEHVLVQKLGMQSSFVPTHTLAIKKNPVVLKIEQLLEDVEQENPVLYQFMQKMLHRYAYVRYPFSFDKDESSTIANAIRIVAERSMYEDAFTYNDERFNQTIEEIELSVSLYLSVIQES